MAIDPLSVDKPVSGMKVRVCKSCHYKPVDLGPNFSTTAAELCCLDCPLLAPKPVAATPRQLRLHEARLNARRQALAADSKAMPGEANPQRQRFAVSV